MTASPPNKDDETRPKSLKELRDQIDHELLKLDHFLCERGRREKVTREQIDVVGISTPQLDAIVAALAADDSLRQEFVVEMSAPRQAAIEEIYRKAQSLGEAKLQAPRQPGRIEEIRRVCDNHQWAARVNAHVDENVIDALIIQAVAYVLGGHSELRRWFHQMVDQRGDS